MNNTQNSKIKKIPPPLIIIDGNSRERERDRQTDRQRHRQTDRDTDKQTDKQTLTD